MKKFLVSLLAIMMLCSSAFALEISEPGVLPLVSGDEKPVITLGIKEHTLTTDYADNYLTKYVEELTGVDLEIVLFPTDTAEAKQKLSLMIAGGQKLPDIISFSMTDAEKLSYGASGYFLPMNDWLENDAYYWNLAMDTWCTPEEKADVIKYSKSADGNIYGYPGYYIDPGDATALGCWVNKAWCEKLGLAVPTTTDELYTVLKAFKENDANGNGDPNDEIPLVGHTGWVGNVVNYLINSFEYSAFNSDCGWQYSVKDGKLYAPYTTDAYREALRYIAKLSAEGLLSPLSFSQTQNELRSIMCAPNEDPTLVGAFVGHPSPLFGADGMIDRVNEYVAVPAMIGPEGVQWTPYAGWFANTNTFITADCENPELAFRVLDAVAQQECSLTWRYGRQDIDWGYSTEGKTRHVLPGYTPIYTLLTPTSVWTEENDVIFHENHFNVLPPKLFAGVAGAAWPNANRTYQMDDLWYKSVPSRFDKHPAETALKLIFTEEEIDMVGEVQATLQTYVAEQATAFVLGNRNIETEWEAYLAELEGIGLPMFLETAQVAYDRLAD